MMWHVLQASGQPADAAAYQRRAEVMDTILKAWRHIKNPALSIDVYLVKNNPTKFHPNPI